MHFGISEDMFAIRISAVRYEPDVGLPVSSRVMFVLVVSLAEDTKAISENPLRNKNPLTFPYVLLAGASVPVSVLVLLVLVTFTPDTIWNPTFFVILRYWN